MMIKKHKNRNEYYYAGNGLWVRNFAKRGVQAVDINTLVTEGDMKLIMSNESTNHTKMLQNIDTEDLLHQKIVIVNNGHGFDVSQKLLESLPADVVVMGVHDVLKLWNNQRRLNYYVVNNPYEECLTYMPGNQRWSRCIASVRTNMDFIDKYKGLTYCYVPTPDLSYSGLKTDADYFIDDYRNAICAAIGLSYRFTVRNIMLMWCDDLYDEGRPGAEQLRNGLWLYPQQKIAHDLVDANLYWLKTAGVKVGYHGKGPEYKNAAYIADDEVAKFFVD